MKRAILTVILITLSVCHADTDKPLNKPNMASAALRTVPDIAYADTVNPRQTLDLILPKNPKADKLPIIVYIHGGAWRAGHKKGGHRQLQRFVSSGNYAGVTVAYRLSQEAVWPAQIHDCKAAIRWIRAHADDYGLNASKLAVWGTSAGGHLVSMLGTSADVDALEGTLGKHQDQSTRVTCVANYFGPSQLLTMDDHPSDIVHNAADSPESQLIGGAIQNHQDKAKQASPITHVTADDAPFLHVHGDQDNLVPYPQSVVLDKALDAKGVPSLLITMAKKKHGRFNHPKLDQLLTDFFAHHLLGKSAQIEEQTLHPIVAKDDSVQPN